DVRADCYISKEMVERTNRIFTYCDASGRYQLLRTETVPRGMTLHMVCTPGDVLETQCQASGCFEPALPMSCGNPMRATPVRVADSDCPQQMYAVGYGIDGRHLELFRACYDERRASVLYAQSEVYHKSYFAKRPSVDGFTTDGIVTPAQAAAYMKHNLYNAFCSILGQTQRYLPSARELVINRGHLVASADFLFVDQMVSTFRYLNVVPQFKSINDGNWEKIERWLRDQVPPSSHLRIKTGGIDVLRLRDESGGVCCVYLAAGDRLPVPQWTYKLVRDATGRGIYAFLTFNSIFERQRPSTPDFCRPVACPLSLPDNADAGFTYCCEPASFPY
ncbi:hypothetical protein KR222_002831, partial [Zaprionus bogoriensis]